MKRRHILNVEVPVDAKNVEAEVTPKGVRISYTMYEKSMAETLKQTESFKWVDFSTLDEAYFERYKPKTRSQEHLRIRILRAITAARIVERKGIYFSIYEPSLNKNFEIQFVKGAMPAFDFDTEWWTKKAWQFCPERKSRMATSDEYNLLIARLIADGVITWSQAADDSSKIGNYATTPKGSRTMEKTGTRRCGDFYGLVGNTSKIVKDKYEFVMYGGSYYMSGTQVAMSNIRILDREDECFNDCVALIVLEE